MKILGIDPGMSGAWMVLQDNVLIKGDDMPVIGAGKFRRLDGGLLHGIWRDSDISLVVLEEVHSMPRDGVTVAFKFGFTCGQLLGIVESLSLPVVFVTPQAWKKHFRLTSDKEDSRKKAIELFPTQRSLFERKKDHGRAEAALIALWGQVASPSKRAEPPQPIVRKRLNAQDTADG